MIFRQQVRKDKEALDEEVKNRYFQGQITSRPSQAETRAEAFTFFIIPPLATGGRRQKQTGVCVKLIRQRLDLTSNQTKKASQKQPGAQDAACFTQETQYMTSKH